MEHILSGRTGSDIHRRLVSVIRNVMTKEEIINYIRKYDSFFLDARLENYSLHELTLIKISIDVEKEKVLDKDYKPLERMKGLL